MRTLFAAVLAALSSALFAQAFPSHPVRIIVAFPPGGSTDITARLVAPKLSEMWKQPVVVENKPGAGANIGTDFVAKSAPDGHTLLLATTALAVSAAVYDKLPYDPLRDLAPVVFVSSIPNLLVANPALPASTPSAFVQYAKANPGKLSYASPGPATGQRLAFELVKQSAGIDFLHVPYKGGAPAGQAVMSGEVQAMIVNLVEALPQVKAGRMKAIAVTTAKRSPMLPDVPTLAETVTPGLDVSVWQGLLVPAATPKEAIARINRDFAAALALPEVRERLAGLGMDLAPGTSAQFDQFLRAEIAQWKKVAQAAGIKAE
ncbi:MAG: tripartite tricarboxylate transporter substrate binding protein [Burkholderiales bacterium]|nr:tripartite tricarboxylate transporter substrate binding protein [Burkholderiales bacterium]